MNCSIHPEDITPSVKIFERMEKFVCNAVDALTLHGPKAFTMHCTFAYFRCSKILRWNPLEVRVTSGQKSSTKIIYIVL